MLCTQEMVLLRLKMGLSKSMIFFSREDPNLRGTQRAAPDIVSTGFTNDCMSPTYRVFERLLWFWVDDSKRLFSELQQVSLDMRSRQLAFWTYFFLDIPRGEHFPNLGSLG